MLIVGIGGTQREQSSSEVCLRLALAGAEALGAEVRCFSGPALLLPHYNPGDPSRTPEARALVEAVREADGIVLASPGYHGTVSGLVKNALDYIEDMAKDERPYLDDLPVGSIGVAWGSQAAVNTLRALRDITHALRGIPVPYGAAVNSLDAAIADGVCGDERTATNLRMVGEQVAKLAMRMSGSAVAPPASETVPAS